ncbi:methylated-DNA--[protein]-cysteine S-methyltransferase [Loigolactobacillus iwatensis]|uniref:methylated-DNA--[protein]-cysteine S-methyltransferase n=1 Tax=Loigolactobacillus iwatensis TaxID=1267156 RepID=UPI000F7E4D3B|nr:methylated-DNA--[protein]-cysteine S-methyltransferase [Loigolactobacillus iwatensis]
MANQLYRAIFNYQGEHYYLFASDQGLVFVGSPDASIDEAQHYLSSSEVANAKEKSLANYERQLNDYFTGKRSVLSIPLDVRTGTKLQQQVWQTLLKIPYGQTWTYTELAAASGYPTAVRAVASAVGANPLLVVIPCHRVVRKDGKLGGYRGGLAMKQRLLSLEA